MLRIKGLGGLLTVVVACLGGLVVPSVSAGEDGEACLGDVIRTSDQSGRLLGSQCAEILVASPKTTSMFGGGGDDIMIGGPNLVFVSGGDGDDYIIGNGSASVLIGEFGDDIIEGGLARDPERFGEDIVRLIEGAASSLPVDERSQFVTNAILELEKAFQASDAEVRVNIALRNRAMRTNNMVRHFVPHAARSRTLINDSKRRRIRALERVSRITSKWVSKTIRKTLGELEKATWEPGNPEQWGDNTNEILVGGRGTDKIYASGGDDLVYGGIEDDELYGQGGNDHILGGHGADTIQGGPDNDILQGDAISDKMSDSSGIDTLSFASGGNKGFPNGPELSGFPNFPAPGSMERGIYVNLTTGVADNGSFVASGGGVDPKSSSPNEGTNFDQFENVVGTPFADYIVGDTGANILEGGGGSDVIDGGGGTETDILIGDAGGDNLVAPTDSWLIGGSGEDYCAVSGVPIECETKPSNWVGARDGAKISVGMTSQLWGVPGGIYSQSQLYMAGSSTNWFNRYGEDVVNVTQFADGSGPPSFYFTTPPSSTKGQFSTSPEDTTPGCSYTATQVLCSPSREVTTLNLAGFGSNDVLSIYDLSPRTNTIVLGGDGNDTLNGSLGAGNVTTDDLLHDGSGSDKLYGLGGDDALINTIGTDEVRGQEGNDLVESTSVCEGDNLHGGEDRDSSSWIWYGYAPFADGYGVVANLSDTLHTVGRSVNGVKSCPDQGTFSTAQSFEDLEGTRDEDILRGDASNNQLIGRAGEDELSTYGGNKDRILSHSADNDLVDCGPGTNDVGIVDRRPPYTDIPYIGADAPGCEGTFPTDPIFTG